MGLAWFGPCRMSCAVTDNHVYCCYLFCCLFYRTDINHSPLDDDRFKRPTHPRQPVDPGVALESEHPIVYFPYQDLEGKKARYDDVRLSDRTSEKG